MGSECPTCSFRKSEYQRKSRGSGWHVHYESEFETKSADFHLSESASFRGWHQGGDNVTSFCCARNPPRAKFLRNFSKRSAKNAANFWRNFSQIFVLQFPGKMAAKNFTKNPRHFPRCTKLSLFTAATLGASWAQHFDGSPDPTVMEQNDPFRPQD